MNPSKKSKELKLVPRNTQNKWKNKLTGGHMENSNLTNSNQVTNKIQELQRTMKSVALEEGCVAMQSQLRHW
nr:hypothetical protein [Tanacetum cinerariifolium]